MYLNITLYRNSSDQLHIASVRAQLSRIKRRGTMSIASGQSKQTFALLRFRFGAANPEGVWLLTFWLTMNGMHENYCGIFEMIHDIDRIKIARDGIPNL